MIKKIIIIILNILVSILFVFQLFRLDILPMKYLLLVIGIMLISLLFGIFLINRKKKGLRIVGYCLFIIFLLVNIFGIYHIKKIDDFFNESFKVVKTEKIKYYVVALSKNKYTKKDISGDIGYYENSMNVNKAIDYLEKNYKVETNNFENINNLFDKLDSDEIKMIVIEKSNFNIILGLDENRNEDNYQVLDEFYVSKKIKNNSKQRDEVFNVYVGGTDYEGLMDFNTIISVNTKTHTVLLTSIPRDYYIDVAGYGYKNKLSFIIEGIDVSKDSLANLFNIDIDYYVKIDSDSVVKLIDEIGGIEYCSDYSYNGSYIYYKNGVRRNGRYSIKKGCQHLDGYEAIAASRTRNAFNGRDRVRQKNMQKIMVAIFKKLSSSETIGNYENILNALANSYETDFPKKIMKRTIKDIINNGNRWTVEVQSVDGEDGKDMVHRFDNLIDWVAYPDYNTVTQATEKINQILSAE